MNEHDFDTSRLWRMLMLLVKSLLTMIIIAFMYLVLEDQITAFVDKPRYTKEQLEEFANNRELKRREERNDNWDLVENGIHVKTGLKADDDLQIIIGSCTSCHSAKLITQNRATRKGWKNMIVWMQETQGLPDLGKREPIILNYLAKYYAPKDEGRRPILEIASIEWYILNLED